MESQPQNPEYRINPENVHPLGKYKLPLQCVYCTVHEIMVLISPVWSLMASRNLQKIPFSVTFTFIA